MASHTVTQLAASPAEKTYTFADLQRQVQESVHVGMTDEEIFATMSVLVAMDGAEIIRSSIAVARRAE